MATKDKGFVTDDFYAAVPCGKNLMIIFNGQQLQLVKSIREANAFIRKHREDSGQGVTQFLD